MTEDTELNLKTPKKNRVLFVVGIAIALIIVIVVIGFIESRIIDNKKVSKAIRFADDYAMVVVQEGSFQMGTDMGWSNQKPKHKVNLNGFYIGKYEVTQKQWKEVMGNNPSRFSGCDDCPVEQVSWTDIQEFIRRINYKNNLGFRLPTEAEWEFAAIGGNKSKGFRYSGSDDKNAVAWYDSNSKGKTEPVGIKDSNELGIYDMSGNVMEWCNDYFDHDYYKSSPTNNPKGPSYGKERVLKGGDWAISYINDEPQLRFYSSPDIRNEYFGFRLCRDIK